MSEVRRIRPTGNLRHPQIPPGAIYVGRPTRFGNPYKVKPNGPYTEEEAVRLFKADLLAGKLRVTVADVRRDLARHDLACWCKLDNQWCHADVLLAVANEAEE